MDTYLICRQYFINNYIPFDILYIIFNNYTKLCYYDKCKTLIYEAVTTMDVAKLILYTVYKPFHMLHQENAYSIKYSMEDLNCYKLEGREWKACDTYVESTTSINKIITMCHNYDINCILQHKLQFAGYRFDILNNLFKLISV